jgi:hypothetical protein
MTQLKRLHTNNTINTPVDTPKLNRILFLNPNFPVLDIDTIAFGPGEIFDTKTYDKNCRRFDIKHVTPLYSIIAT